MAIGNNPIENYVAVVKQNQGLYTELPIETTSNLLVAGNLTVTGDIVVDDITIDDLTVDSITATTTAAGVLGAGVTTITATDASALAVGRQGATAPALVVSSAGASSATGVSVTAAAAASGVAVAAISSGTDESLTIDAKGSGTITLNGTGTGNIVLGRAMTGVSSSLTGGYVAKSATAVPASAGAVAAGAPLTMFSSGPSIYVTSDAPAFSAVKGSICINTAGSSSSTRIFVNDGTTNWVAVTTAT